MTPCPLEHLLGGHDGLVWSGMVMQSECRPTLPYSTAHSRYNYQGHRAVAVNITRRGPKEAKRTGLGWAGRGWTRMDEDGCTSDLTHSDASAQDEPAVRAGLHCGLVLAQGG